MARTYFCASCGWKRSKKSDPGRCPECGSLTQRYQTAWDGVVIDLKKVAVFCTFFSAAAFVWTWLMYPNHMDGNDFTARFHVDCVSLMDSPNGSIARLSLQNDSQWEMARVDLTVQIHAMAAGNQMETMAVVKSKTIALQNLGPHSEQFLDVPVEGRKAGELFGWMAKIESVRLPPGYWNKRLESALSPRLIGLDKKVPASFPHNSPIRHRGQ